MELAFEDLSFSFPGGAEVIRHCNLHLAHGETLALLGPSGCGKTTLLKLLLGLFKPTEGRILADGKPLDSSRTIGAILSECRLFPWMTLEENLCLVGQREQARAYLDRLGMLRWADYYPSAISVGMTQKIRLCRLALQPAELWLLDEPFNGLDLNSKQQAQAFLKEIKGDKTAILVTHNPQEATAFADRVIFWDRAQKRPEQEWINHSDTEELLNYMLQNALGMGMEE